MQCSWCLSSSETFGQWTEIKEDAFPAMFVRSLIHFRSLRVTKDAKVIAPLYTPLGFTTTHINSHQLTITHCNCLHLSPLSPTFSTFRPATLGVDSKVAVPNSWGTPHRDLVVLNAHLEVLSGFQMPWINGKMTSVDENPILTDRNMFTDVHQDGIKTGIGWLGARICQNPSLSFLTPKQCSSMDQDMFLWYTLHRLKT